MTTEAHQPASRSQRNRRRPHPAQNARLITGGAAATITFSVLAALSFSEKTSAQSVAPVGVSPEAESITPRADVIVGVQPEPIPIPVHVVVIRRIHRVAPATASPDSVQPSPAAPDQAKASSFNPKPATRTKSATKSTARKRVATKKKAVAKKRSVRVAPASSRAS